MSFYFHMYRGVPGSGKSTAALKLKQIFDEARLPCNHYEADMFFMKNGEYQFDISRIQDAHEWCQEKTRESLEQGVATIVSNTFTTWKEIHPYINMVAEMNKWLFITTMMNEYGSVHNVPIETIDRMRARLISHEKISGHIVAEYELAMVSLDTQSQLLYAEFPYGTASGEL